MRRKKRRLFFFCCCNLIVRLKWSANLRVPKHQRLMFTHSATGGTPDVTYRTASSAFYFAATRQREIVWEMISELWSTAVIRPAKQSWVRGARRWISTGKLAKKIRQHNFICQWVIIVVFFPRNFLQQLKPARWERNGTTATIIVEQRVHDNSDNSLLNNTVEN